MEVLLTHSTLLSVGAQVTLSVASRSEEPGRVDVSFVRKNCLDGEDLLSGTNQVVMSCGSAGRD